MFALVLGWVLFVAAASACVVRIIFCGAVGVDLAVDIRTVFAIRYLWIMMVQVSCLVMRV